MNNKSDFDAALIPDFRVLTKNTYNSLRKAESDSFSELLDDEGNFLDRISILRNCPFCGSHYKNSVENYFTRGMHIVTCNDCQFTYSREVIKQSYEEQRYLLSVASEAHIALKNNAVYQALESKKTKYVIDVLSKYITLNKVAIRMLDVGSALGSLLLAAHERGWFAEGVEANPSMVRICQEKQLCVKQGFFPDVLMNDTNQYDVITLLDVLEHVENPINFIVSLKSFLSNQNIVAIQVPNFQSLAIRLEGENNNNLVHGHWSYFTPQTLNNVMEKAGFENLFLETYISEFDKIQQFHETKIQSVIKELTGKSLNNLDELTIDWLHENLLGYKIFGVYRLK